MKTSASFDWVILICILVLCGFGAAIIGSVAPLLLLSQLTFYVGGLIVFFIVSRIDYHLYADLSRPIYLVSFILLIITLIIGFESRGAVRWIPLGPFNLQFSEILKPFLIAAFAGVLSKNQHDYRFSDFLFHCLWFLVPTFLVLKQPDLGSAIVYTLAFLSMIIAAGGKLSYLVASIFPSFLALPIFWHFLADYQKARIFSFFNPQADPLGASYNAIQAVVSVGSGLLFGRGLGRGTQSHLSFLPERHTDFIFASLAEELGFVGAVAVLLALFILVWRILSAASRGVDLLARTMAAGIAVLLLTQLFINIGMNVGLVPVTGITLPLISYGGSSVLSTMIGLGIIENIIKRKNSENTIIIV